MVRLSRQHISSVNLIWRKISRDVQKLILGFYEKQTPPWNWDDSECVEGWNRWWWRIWYFAEIERINRETSIFNREAIRALWDDTLRGYLPKYELLRPPKGFLLEPNYIHDIQARPCPSPPWPYKPYLNNRRMGTLFM
jgi:hypothetical protein